MTAGESQRCHSLPESPLTAVEAPSWTEGPDNPADDDRGAQDERTMGGGDA